MIPPKKPDNETARLAALRGYEILDTLPEQSYDDLLRIAAGICRTPMGAVTLVDDERQWFKSRLGVAAEETPRDVAFCGHAILVPDEVMVVPDARSDARFHDNPLVSGDPRIRFYAGAPVIAGGEAVGTVCVFDDVPHELSQAEREALQSLARQVSVLLDARRHARILGHHLRERDWYEQQLLQYQAQLEAHNADLAELSRTDALTGLPNRRAFDAALQAAAGRMGDAGGLAVALIDIDHFKTINDLHGHPVGDQVLASVAQVLRASAGSAATVARYGGEEFALLLHVADAGAAELQAQYVREAVQNLPIGFPVTVSIGLAMRRGDVTPAALLDRADRALYAAKRGGRNRVELAGE